MELETEEANLRAGANGVDEIDLYDDLIAFTDLSPEEQEKAAARRAMNKPEPEPQSANQFFYADLAASDEPAPDPLTQEEDRSFELIEQSSFGLIERPVIQPVEEPSMPQNEPAFQENREPSFKLVEADKPTQKKSDYLDLTYLLRVTGPLVALGATSDSASPLLVCVDCGSQASSEDMFCVTCGGLLDRAEAPEAAAVGAANSACEGCGSPVEEGEIFCPCCGAVSESF